MRLDLKGKTSCGSRADHYRRFEKVGHLLHTLFSLLLCFVDMRLGIGESAYSSCPLPASLRACGSTDGHPSIVYMNTTCTFASPRHQPLPS